MMKKIGLLAVATLSIFSLVACSSQKTQAKKADEVTTVETTEAEKTTFTIGEKIVFEGQAEFTITNVEWTEERNQFEADFLETVPDKVLKVTYDVTNLSKEDLYVGSDLSLYVSGAKMETYPNTNTMDTLSTGRSLQGAVQHFGVIGSGEMELEVVPFASFSSEPAIVKLDLQ